MTRTPNYNLKKPAQMDFYNVDDHNFNSDTIDTALKAHADSLAKKADLDTSGKVKAAQLPAMDYVPTAQKAAANGVATLGSDGKVPSAQLPAMDYIPNSKRGAANGVATLGSDGKVPTAQLPSMSSGSVFYTSYRGRGSVGVNAPTTVRAPLVNGQQVLPTSIKFMDQYGSFLEIGGTLSWANGWTDVGYLCGGSIIEIKARITKDASGYAVQLYDPAGYASQQFSENGDTYWCVFTFGESFV